MTEYFYSKIEYTSIHNEIIDELISIVEENKEQKCLLEKVKNENNIKNSIEKENNNYTQVRKKRNEEFTYIRTIRSDIIEILNKYKEEFKISIDKIESINRDINRFEEEILDKEEQFLKDFEKINPEEYLNMYKEHIIGKLTDINTRRAEINFLETEVNLELSEDRINLQNKISELKKLEKKYCNETISYFEDLFDFKKKESELTENLVRYQLEIEKEKDKLNQIFLQNIEKLKTLKYKKISYYNSHLNKNKPIFMEIFSNFGLSKIEDINGKIIGYRYYRDGIINNFKNNDFVTVCEGTDGEYHIISKNSNIEEDFKIISSIFKRYYRNKPEYEITGNRQKSIGVNAISKYYSNVIYIFNPGEELQKDYYPKIAKNAPIGQVLTCFNVDVNNNFIFANTGSDIKTKFKKIVDEKIPKRNGLCLFPLSFGHHTTLLITEQQLEGQLINKPIGYLIDFSLAHCAVEKDREYILRATGVDPSFFANMTQKIELLNRFPLQITGCCSFYLDAAIAVIANPKNNYANIQKIKEDCENGTMWLKVATLMGQTFDIEQNYPTVKEFLNEEEASDSNSTNKYVIFNKNGIFFGISKKCYNNKFMNIEILSNKYLKDVQVSSNLSKQIELQKHIIGSLYMTTVFNKFDGYAEKPFEALNKIIKKNIKKEEDQNKLENSQKGIELNYGFYKEMHDNFSNFKEEHQKEYTDNLKSLINMNSADGFNQDKYNKMYNNYIAFRTMLNQYKSGLKNIISNNITSEEVSEYQELLGILEQLDILEESIFPNINTEINTLNKNLKNKSTPNLLSKLNDIKTNNRINYNIVANLPQSFIKKQKLRRSNSLPNLSFREKEELKKQKRTSQLPEF